MKIVGVVFGVLALAAAVPASAADVVATSVAAQAPVALKTGDTIRTADGRHLGKVDHVVFDRAGTPVSAKVIYDGRFLSVPVSSIARADKGVTTSLTLAALRSTK